MYAYLRNDLNEYNMTRISIDIPDELHHYLKVHTAHTKDTIVNFVTDAIYKKVEQEKQLNKETIKKEIL